jgi:hypothetical protein
MRRLILFSLILCFHLSGDRTVVCGSTPNGKIAQSFCAYLHHAKSVASTNENQGRFLQHAADLPRENDLLLFEEEDNEEEYTRKLKSPTEPASIFFYAFTISHPGAALANVISFYNDKAYAGDCKYIAYRALRI